MCSRGSAILSWACTLAARGCAGCARACRPEFPNAARDGPHGGQQWRLRAGAWSVLRQRPPVSLSNCMAPAQSNCVFSNRNRTQSPVDPPGLSDGPPAWTERRGLSHCTASARIIRASRTQGWPSRAESRSRDSRLGDSAKMSDSATRRLGDSGFIRAVIRPQDRVPQDHLRSHCIYIRCTAQGSILTSLASRVAATILLIELQIE